MGKFDDQRIHDFGDGVLIGSKRLYETPTAFLVAVKGRLGWQWAPEVDQASLISETYVRGCVCAVVMDSPGFHWEIADGPGSGCFPCWQYGDWA